MIFLLGGLAIAVPGELKAYQAAHTRFGGGVSWSELFQPTIRLCREGFVVSATQATAIRQSSDYILNDPAMRLIIFIKLVNKYAFCTLF
jgi:gamma-glutamyltranspeptidase/glutathione hydrolase/leukotriene-C4 hydrolase